MTDGCLLKFFKIVSVFPDNNALGKPAVLGKMMVINSKTGDVDAILDGTYLTQLRTGALQGAATNFLARKNAKIVVLFGTGGQAATQLEAIVASMQNEFSHFKPKIFAMADGNQAIKEADIITAITTSKTPVFDGSLVKKGAHVNGMGAYMPQMQELPETLVRVADRIIFDTNEGVNRGGRYFNSIAKRADDTFRFSG